MTTTQERRIVGKIVRLAFDCVGVDGSYNLLAHSAHDIITAKHALKGTIARIPNLDKYFTDAIDGIDRVTVGGLTDWLIREGVEL